MKIPLGPISQIFLVKCYAELFNSMNKWGFHSEHSFTIQKKFLIGSINTNIDKN